MDEARSELVWYTEPGPLTDLSAHRDMLECLPPRVDALRDAVQGLVVHDGHQHRYGLDPDPGRSVEENIRPTSALLHRILELDPAPLDRARPPERRLVGSCRTFSVLMSALLRHVGIPARARCGFLSYFGPSEFAWDHWVCEYWDQATRKWVLVDAQLDEVQIMGLASEGWRIEFDPLDVPRDRFLVAGRAWELCRAGSRDPRRFGIGNLTGLWFIRGNVIRDLAALNKVELLPRDAWGRIERLDLLGTADDTAVIERAAAATSPAHPDVEMLWSLFHSDPLLQPGPFVSFFGNDSKERHHIPELETASSS